MTTRLQVLAFGITHSGKIRKRNEDAFCIDTTRQVYAVADGLGGLSHGDLASQLAVEDVLRFWQDPVDWPSLYERINKEVREANIDEVPMGTTLTAAHIREDAVLSWAHVGDSRIYILGQGVVTRDQTFAQKRREECIARGQPPLVPEHYEHILTQCLGQRKPLELETGEYDLSQGGRFLIYSDGLTKTHEQAEIADALESSDSPKVCVERLLEECLRFGAPDNVTLLAVFTEPSS